MFDPQLFELPISRTDFHGTKDVRAIEVRLYFVFLQHLKLGYNFATCKIDLTFLPLPFFFFFFFLCGIVVTRCRAVFSGCPVRVLLLCLVDSV